PMRTYSSGMSARLRFSIAAVKDHDVLLVDEALATGDASFRKRSEARIRQLREQAGTVFLVSHSNKSIRDTCERALWLEHGELR
ncbi:ABC transporter ATP-binding protein, partial [Streptomyces sp. SID11233]|nr:ABC transporter ATP-binding protein [Streptomyces sp. SID11233]